MPANLYRRRVQQQGRTARKAGKSVCFVGYDGELHRVAPGEAGATARAILHETLVRVLHNGSHT